MTYLLVSVSVTLQYHAKEADYFRENLLWFKIPFFDLKTNVKDVPAEFNKETTDLIANLLGKPNSVSVQTFGLILVRGKRKPNQVISDISKPLELN